MTQTKKTAVLSPHPDFITHLGLLPDLDEAWLLGRWIELSERCGAAGPFVGWPWLWIWTLKPPWRWTIDPFLNVNAWGIMARTIGKDLKLHPSCAKRNLNKCNALTKDNISMCNHGYVQSILYSNILSLVPASNKTMSSKTLGYAYKNKFTYCNKSITEILHTTKDQFKQLLSKKDLNKDRCGSKWCSLTTQD
jgi:hypothetical protein